VLACVWLGHCLPRIPREIREFRASSDPIHRIAIGLMWSGSVLAAWWLAGTALEVARAIAA